MSLLEIKDLVVSAIKNKEEKVDILKGVTFSLEKREVLGIVGESGSGKTMTALSIMGLLPERVYVTSGNILFSGQDLITAKESDMQKIRGKKISMIFQDPQSSLNPVMSVGNQMLEMFNTLLPDFGGKRKKQIIEILRKMGIPDPERRYNSFPHELSGGMNQRVMIGMMLIKKPKILIADEPTTALDVTIEKRILTRLKELVGELGISLVLITHNLGLVAEHCDRVVVMNEGQIVEAGDVFQIFEAPSHPYTRKLLDEVPKI